MLAIIGLSLLHACLAIFSYLVFTRWLLVEYDARATVISLFVVNLTTCLSMLSIIVCEIQSIFTHSVRTTVWEFDVAVLCCTLLIGLPMHIWVTLFRTRFGFSKRYALLAACVQIVYLWLFFKIGDYFPVIDASAGAPSHWKDEIVGRIGVVGVTAVGILSGFGTVNTPFRWLRYFTPIFSDADMKLIERRLHHTINMIALKKRRLKKMQLRRQIQDSHSQINGNERSLVSRLCCRLCIGRRVNPEDLRIAQSAGLLQQELAALQPLCSELFLEIHGMRLSRRRVRLSKTLYGRLLNLLGHVLFIYCIFKTLNAFVNIVLARDRTIDPITKFLVRLCYVTNIQLDQATIEFWTQHLSFGMIGVVVFSNVRGFLNTVGKMFTSFTSGAVSADLLGLVLAWVMGMYFLSQILLMRMQIPEKYRGIVSSLPVNFQFFYKWFDQIYLCSIVATAVTLWVLKKSSKRSMDESKGA